jgi:hypothetical protein
LQNDLPRVTCELEALKKLAHQNICRMFQYVETEEKYVYRFETIFNTIDRLVLFLPLKNININQVFLKVLYRNGVL